jgi:hypothetical protein
MFKKKINQRKSNQKRAKKGYSAPVGLKNEPKEKRMFFSYGQKNLIAK